MEDDEESKKRVQELVWNWTGRILVLLVVFGGGAFLGWILWGSGNAGAVQLRPRVGDLETQLGEQKKRVIDCEGRLVVVQGRLNEVQRAVQQKAAGAAN